MVMLMGYHCYEELSVKEKFAASLLDIKQKNKDFNENFQQCSDSLVKEKKNFENKVKELDPISKKLNELMEEIKKCTGRKWKSKS